MALAFDVKGNQAGSGTVTVNLTLDATVKLLVVTIVNAASGGARAGGAPTWNTTETLTQVGSTISGSAECDTEMWYLLNPTSGAHSVSVPNTGSDVLNVIASSYKGATAAVLDQSTSTNTTAANPSLTLNNVPDGSVVVDVLGSGYKDAVTGNTGGTLLYGVDNVAWNDAGQNAHAGFDRVDPTGTTGYISVYSGQDKISQSFAGISGALNSCIFHIRKLGAPTGNVTAYLYNHSGVFGTSSVPTGVALATSNSIDISTLPTTGFVTTEFIFSSPYTISAGNNYCIVIEYTGGSGTDALRVNVSISISVHAGNYAQYTASWAATANNDIFFVVISTNNTESYTLSYTQLSDDVAMIMASFKEVLVGSETPSHTPSHTKSHTKSHTPSHTKSATPSSTISHSVSGTPSHTQSPSATISHSVSGTPSHTQSPSGTPSRTKSATPSHTQSISATPSHTPSATPSFEKTGYVADANCEAAWLFRTGSGTIVFDDTGNGNTGNFLGDGNPSWSATVPAAYEPYSALFVSGDYIDCGGSTPSPGSGDFTLVTWVRSSDIDAFAISTRADSTSQGYEILVGRSSTATLWQVRAQGATAARVSSNLENLNDNAFHHIALVITGGVSPYGKVYLDGVFHSNLDGDPGAITNSQNFFFGKRGSTVIFDGYVGESAIFSRALSVDEIVDIKNNGLLSVGASNTPSHTISHSISGTPSHTISHSVSGTPSRTKSHTPSHTQSPSGTPSATISHTPSPTLGSETPSHTASHTQSISATPSHTKSLTPSHTPSRTKSATPSATKSHSVSGTPSSTQSGTPSATPSSTKSHSISATPSHTISHTKSLTPSATPSATKSHTPSHTQSISATPSHTKSHTPSHTPSPSGTPSHTKSATPSHTQSPSATPSSTKSHTPSHTQSPSGTPSATISHSVSGTPSHTQSPSGTPSRTKSATPSHTQSISATPSHTPSATPSQELLDSLPLKITKRGYSPIVVNSNSPYKIFINTKEEKITKILR